MNQNISKYLGVFKASWKLQIEYRSDLFGQFLVASISLISIFYLWNDVYGSSNSILGLTKQQLISYYILSAYLLFSLPAKTSLYQDIAEGNLSTQLTKPINHIMQHFFAALSVSIFKLLLGLPVILIIFLILQEHLFFVLNPLSYLLLLLTSAGAFAILFLLDILICSIEFWHKHGSTSLESISEVIVSFFSGAVIPLMFLPGFLQTIADYLPFKYTSYFLINTFLGRASTNEIIFGISMQLAWIMIIAIIVKQVWKIGLKRYEAFGG